MPIKKGTKLAPRAADLTGQRFGRLAVEGRAGSNSGGNATWWCRCDCGGRTRSVGTDLRKGKTVGCGCQAGRRASGEAIRLWATVARGRADECWPWLGALTDDGYGRIRRDDGTKVGAHRLAWLLTHGEIAEGLVIDHLCRNRTCCNPAHLEPVTNQTNLRRGHAARRNLAATAA